MKIETEGWGSNQSLHERCIWKAVYLGMFWKRGKSGPQFLLERMPEMYMKHIVHAKHRVQVSMHKEEI